MRQHFLPAGLFVLCLACRSIPGPPLIAPVKTAWSTPLEAALEGPLATDGVRIFAAGQDGSLRALDRTTGAVRWRAEGKRGMIAASPRLLVKRDHEGNVDGLDPETGELLWETPMGFQGELPPVVDGDRIFIAGEGLAALDAARGVVVWRVPDPAPTVVLAPVVGTSEILVAEADGTLRCRERASGSTRWTLATRPPLLAPPLVAKSSAFLGTTDRRFLCLHLDSGKIRWRWKMGADVESAPTTLGARIFMDGDEDVLYALDAGTGGMAWRALLPSRPIAGPVLAKTAVVVACRETDVVAFDSRTGKRLASFKAPSEIRTPPLILGDQLVLGLRNPVAVASLQMNMALSPALPEAPINPKSQARRRPAPGH